MFLFSLELFLYFVYYISHKNIYKNTMFTEKTQLKCQVCGSNEVHWTGHYYVSLQCDDCKFEVYPKDEFASEEEFINEWNSYVDVDKLLELNKDCSETRDVLVSKKKQLDKLRRERKMLLQWSERDLLARRNFFWLFFFLCL